MLHWVSGKRLGFFALQAGLASVALAGAAGAQEEVWSAEDPADAPGQATELADDGGDITETIGDPEPESAEDVAVSEAEEPPPPESRVRLSGFVRQSMELVYGQLQRESSTGSSPLLWRDVFLSRSQLWLKASYVEDREFEATVSGVLGYGLHVAKSAPQYSIGTVDLTRGQLDSELREAYLGFYWPAADLRIGQQRIAWGRSDFQSPNDVLNARDLRDPFLSEAELRHLPTMAVRSSFSFGALTFEAVVTPLFTPDRYDVYGTTWSAVQRRAPEQLQRFLGTTSLVVDPTVEPELRDVLRATELPEANGKGASAGARLSASLPGADFSLYYHYGYDPTPFVRIAPAFGSWLQGAQLPSISEGGSEFAGVEPALSPALDLIDQGIEPFSARFLRRHHVGLDAATVLGPLVLRVDAAYETRRVFYTPDLVSFSTPAVLGVLGLEYQTGSLNDVVLLEVLASRLLTQSVPLLLGYERTTTALAGTIKWSLGEAWGLDLRGLVGLNPETYVLQPALRFKPNESVSVRLGALLVSGATASLGWYFADNDTAFLQLLYSF